MLKRIFTIFATICILSGNFVFAEEAQSTPPSIRTQPMQHTPATNSPLVEPVMTPVVPFRDTDSPLHIQASADIPTYTKISLPGAIDYALSHNLDIKGNRLNVDIAKNNIKTANRLKNPSLFSFFNSGKAATDNPDTGGLLFPIEIAKRGPRKNMAKSNLELTKGNVALAELNLRMDVRQAYIDLVSAKSTLKILNDHKILLQELLEVAQRKYEVGAVPQMDVIHSKMTLNQLLIQVNSANTAVYTARYEFNRMLNSQCFDSEEDYLPEQSDFIYLLTPKSVEKMPDFNELLNLAFEKRLDLKNAQKDIEVAQKNLTLTIRQRVPDIELGAGVMFVPEQFATSDKSTTGMYFAGNITNIPLLYQYSPEIKNARLQVEQKQLAYNSLRNQSTMTLHSAYDEFNTAKDNLNYYDDILLSESRQFLDMAKRSYKVGKSNITDFIFIQQSYKNIMIGYTEALQYYYNSWVNILREVNDEELKLHG
jgi:outer membrane protein TolC